MGCNCNSAESPRLADLFRFKQGEKVSVTLPGKIKDNGTKNGAFYFLPVFALAMPNHRKGALISPFVGGLDNNDSDNLDAAWIEILKKAAGRKITTASLGLEIEEATVNHIIQSAPTDKITADSPYHPLKMHLALTVTNSNGSTDSVVSATFTAHYYTQAIDSLFLEEPECMGWHLFDCHSEWHSGDGWNPCYTICDGPCDEGNCVTFTGKKGCNGWWFCSCD